MYTLFPEKQPISTEMFSSSFQSYLVATDRIHTLDSLAAACNQPTEQEQQGQVQQQDPHPHQSGASQAQQQQQQHQGLVQDTLTQQGLLEAAVQGLEAAVQVEDQQAQEQQPSPPMADAWCDCPVCSAAGKGYNGCHACHVSMLDCPSTWWDQ